MTEDEKLRLLRKISSDIGELKHYLKFLSADSISATLNGIATTPERQQMWRLANGLRNNEEIANQIGVSLRSVQYFVQEAENAGLVVSERRGYPKRVEEIIPKEWKAWKRKRVKTKIEPKPEKSLSEEDI